MAKTVVKEANRDKRDQKLLGQIASGKGAERAIAKLYDYYASAIYSHALRVSRSADIADEIVQETMMSVWRRASSYQVGKGSVSTWLFTIAHNKTVDYIRKSERQRNIENKIQENWQETVEETEEIHLDINEAMNSLTEKQQQLVQLSFLDGRTHNEIAESLQMPVGTVKSQLYAALKILKRELS